VTADRSRVVVKVVRADQFLRRMNLSVLRLLLLIAVLCCAVLPVSAQVNVTQEHNNLSRDGVYIDAAFTPSAAASLTRDLNFDGTISGHVYAQSLWSNGNKKSPVARNAIASARACSP
jgi:hypothetical protein